MGKTSKTTKKMKTSTTRATDAWSDVLLVETPEPVLSFRTGLLTYEESLTKGQFVSRG